MTSTTIGFVGLGTMGGPMSANLVAGGFPVRGFDLSAAALDALAQAGGIPCDTLGEAVRDAGVVILMLPSSNEVEAVARDPRFAVAPGATVVDMSSSEPARTQALAAELARRNVTLVDAPVSGGVRGARSATLTIMVGGDQDVFDRLRPVFAPLGNPVHVGPVGAGDAVKALNNLLSATHLLSTAEAMAAGQRFGLDPQVMLEVFNSSSGQSRTTSAKWPSFISPGTFDSGFALRLMVKDMRIALGLAEQVGTAGQLSREALRIWAAAADDLPPDADQTELAPWVERLSAAENAEGDLAL